MRFISKPDMVAHCYERGVGQFSVESEESFQKRLHVMHLAVKRGDTFDSIYIPQYLKNMVKRFNSEAKKARK